MHNKSIRLISTGGTIASKPTEYGLAPGLTAEEMLDIIGLNSGSISCTDLFNLDSSNLQPSDWLKIADEINRTTKNRDIDGIVLTHGTDTLAYTASMLSFILLDLRIPVVITGAQMPITDEKSDGRRNLRDAIDAACKLPAGVYVVFGGSVIAGTRAVKTHTQSLHAFQSINYPYIAEIDEGGFTMLHNVPERNIPEDMTGNICADVALVKLTPGINAKWIESISHCDIKGLVVESFGMGGIHRSLNKSLIKLMQRGIVVVLTSQCLYETASLDVYEVSHTLRDAGAIAAGDMTTETAITKLMWLLGQTKDPEKVKEMFLTNYCGEC